MIDDRTRRLPIVPDGVSMLRYISAAIGGLIPASINASPFREKHTALTSGSHYQNTFSRPWEVAVARKLILIPEHVEKKMNANILPNPLPNFLSPLSILFPMPPPSAARLKHVPEEFSITRDSELRVQKTPQIGFGIQAESILA